MRDLVNKWLTKLKIEGLSAHSIDSYTSDLDSFLLHLDRKNLHPKDIEPADLREFIIHRLSVDNVSSVTIERQLSAIRGFMRYLHDTKQIESLNIEHVGLKKQSRKLPGVVDVELVIKLLDQPAPSDPFQAQLWIRDKAMLEMFYTAGLRLSELQGLRFQDLDLQRLQVRVLGKGGKVRVVPIGTKARDGIQDWYKLYREWGFELVNNSPIFITQTGNQLQCRQISNRVKKQALRAGIGVDLHPHLLRHCFATHMLENSGDVRAVQEMLGHSSLNTTQKYTHLDFSHMANVYDKSHPRASKTKK